MVSDCCWLRPIHSSICLPVEEELAPAVGVVRTEPRRLAVRGNVDAVEPELAVDDPSVRVLQCDPPAAERLDLRALQDDPALDGLEDLVVVAGAAVGRDHPVAAAGAARSLAVCRVRLRFASSRPYGSGR